MKGSALHQVNRARELRMSQKAKGAEVGGKAARQTNELVLLEVVEDFDMDVGKVRFEPKLCGMTLPLYGGEVGHFKVLSNGMALTFLVTFRRRRNGGKESGALDRGGILR